MRCEKCGLGRGYIIGSQQEYARLRRKTATSKVLGICLALAIWPLLGVGIITAAGMGVRIPEYMFPRVPATAAFVAFALSSLMWWMWVRRDIHRLQPSPERTMTSETLAVQAHVYSLTRLWVTVIGSLGFVCIGIYSLISNSGNWLSSALLVVVFGFTAVNGARMLLLRRRG